MSYKLIIFDYNGTLVNTPWVEKQPLHILPGRKEELVRLREMRIPLAVATNQAGPLWYTATSRPHFPSILSVARELSKMKRMLAMEQDLWLVSLYDSRAMALLNSQYEQQKLIEPSEVLKNVQHEMERELTGTSIRVGIEKDWRKPEPGMLLSAMRHYEIEAGNVCKTVNEVLYVGDLPEDEVAAHAAGVSFMWTYQFFDRKGEVR